MGIHSFIKELFAEGAITVTRETTPFGERDKDAALSALREAYGNARLQLPGNAPDFSPQAALWAAEYLCRAAQLTVLRDLGEEEVKRLLSPYPAPPTPSAVASADLCLRHLPRLIQLAKGLSPDDILVRLLHQTATEWPFSSVGMKLQGTPRDHAILQHPSLAAAYADRIILHKDFDRAKNRPALQALITGALGDYAETLCPSFKGWEGDSSM